LNDFVVRLRERGLSPVSCNTFTQLPPTSAKDRPARPFQHYDCRSSTQEADMAVVVTRSAGMLLLSVWLILTGLGGLVAVPIPGVLMAALALIAGGLILVGR
jgi:hypothetical protein